MLEAIRKHAQGWLAKVILALIAITFALFGIDSYMSGDKSGGMVAEVGDVGISREELTREIQAQSDRMREALGPAFDPAATETAEFRKQVLDSLIERKALLQDAQQAQVPGARRVHCVGADTDPVFPAGRQVFTAAL